MPTTPLLIVGGYIQRQMRSSSPAAKSQQIPEQEHPQGQTPVRAIALSISSVPVAAPAPGHDLRRHLMTVSSRARENAESAACVAHFVQSFQ